MVIPFLTSMPFSVTDIYSSPILKRSHHAAEMKRTAVAEDVHRMVVPEVDLRMALLPHPALINMQDLEGHQMPVGGPL